MEKIVIDSNAVAQEKGLETILRFVDAMKWSHLKNLTASDVADAGEPMPEIGPYELLEPVDKFHCSVAITQGHLR